MKTKIKFIVNVLYANLSGNTYYAGKIWNTQNGKQISVDGLGGIGNLSLDLQEILDLDYSDVLTIESGMKYSEYKRRVKYFQNPIYEHTLDADYIKENLL